MEQLQSNTTSLPSHDTEGERLFREHGTPRPARRGAQLYAPGDAAAHTYLVARGEVKLSRFTAEGRELTLEHMGPGGVFGETEVLLGQPREAEAVARTDVLLYQLERGQLYALMADSPRLSLWLSRLLGARQARMESRMERLLFRSANGKVAQVLLDLAAQHGRPAAGGTLIDYPITHQEIGNLIATTRETVSYAFMDFRRRGLISTPRRRTVIHDAAGLEDVAMV